MMGSLIKGLRVPVISLGVLVVSLVFAEAAVPVVETLAPITQGVSSPLRLTMDGDGFIYVTDSAACGILKLNPYGQLVSTFKTPVPPQGIAVTSDGSMIITQNDAVIVLDKNGVQTGSLGQGVGQFKKANGITVDENGYIYVVDTGANAFQVFTPSGQFVKKVGAYGTLAGQFNGPTGIAYNKVTKEIVVADSFNARLQFFDTVNYVWKRTVGSLGSTALKFTSPQGISFEYITDATGATISRMYVVDAFQSCVQVIELGATPTFQAFIGNYGYRPGQLVVPPDLVYDQTNKRLIVANGAGYLNVYGIDGGSSPALDTTPPTLVVDPVAQITSTDFIVLSGNVESGANIVINGDTSISSSVSYTSSTTWYATVTNLVPGSNSITVSAVDGAGNISRQTVAVFYELPPPSLAINDLPQYVKSTGIMLSGTVDAGAVVNVAADPVGDVKVTYPATGIWQADVTGLANGSTTFTVTAQRPASTMAVVSAVTTVDTISPAVVIATPADGIHVDGPVATVSGTVSDANLLQVTINGTPAQISAAGFTGSVNLVPGSNVINVVAKDMAGNASSAAVTIVYELPAPALSMDSLPQYSKEVAFTVSGTVDVDATVTLSAENGTVSTVSYPQAGTWKATVAALADGKVTVSVLAQKAYSKVAVVKATTNIDTVSPAFVVSALANGSYTAAQVQNISGTVTEPNLQGVSINGLPVVVLDGAFSGAVNLIAGRNIITVEVTDLAGNSASDTRAITFDDTVPTITVLAPADGLYTNTTVATISGTVAEKVAPLANVTVAGIPAVVTGFDWNAVVSLKDGLNTVDIVATDLAGNSASAKRTITVDVAKPEVAITLPGQDLATSEAALAVSGTVSDASGVIVTAAINGNQVPVAVTGTSFSLSATFATAGSYAISVTAVDAAGNSATATRTILYAPVTTAGEPKPTQQGGGATVAVPTAPPADKVQVTLPAVVDGPSAKASETAKSQGSPVVKKPETAGKVSISRKINRRIRKIF